MILYENLNNNWASIDIVTFKEKYKAEPKMPIDSSLMYFISEEGYKNYFVNTLPINGCYYTGSEFIYVTNGAQLREEDVFDTKEKCIENLRNKILNAPMQIQKLN